MPNCCYPEEYGDFFTAREAWWTARRYRLLGLRGSERDLADGLVAAGIEGATVLEVGGGVGHIQTSLLEAGADHAINVELSPSWEDAARELLRERGLADRVDRRVGDFVDLADELPEADLVLLHRVLCCYPDWPALVAAAATVTGRVLGLTLPVDRWWTRGVFQLLDRCLRWRGRRFRVFVHPPERILDALRDRGLYTVRDEHGLVWRTIVLQRPT